ncbi:hypothetical protein [Microcoleus sp. B4-C2]|uniref:hypothetical protein n=1 Tax=Microcoleus sp. B4-C2 TaxID=2818661 RepID=UPI002FD53134
MYELQLKFIGFNSHLPHILHPSQEQAFRPVPQRVNFLVEQAEKPVHKKLIEKGATSQIYRLHPSQEQARCLFHKE